MKQHPIFHQMIIATILIGVLIPFSAIAADVPADGKAADVNGKAITYADFDRQLAIFQKQVMQGQVGHLPDALMQRLKTQVIRKMARS